MVQRRDHEGESPRFSAERDPRARQDEDFDEDAGAAAWLGRAERSAYESDPRRARAWDPPWREEARTRTSVRPPRHHESDAPGYTSHGEAGGSVHTDHLRALDALASSGDMGVGGLRPLSALLEAREGVARPSPIAGGYGPSVAGAGATGYGRRPSSAPSSGFHPGDAETPGRWRSSASERPSRREPRRGPFYGRAPIGYTRSDSRIREDVCDLLMLGEVDPSRISVDVRDGEVILEGQVESREDKYRVEELAESVLGVHEVDNRLKSTRRSSGFRP